VLRRARCTRATFATVPDRNSLGLSSTAWRQCNLVGTRNHVIFDTNRRFVRQTHAAHENQIRYGPTGTSTSGRMPLSQTQKAVKGDFQSGFFVQFSNGTIENISAQSVNPVGMHFPQPYGGGGGRLFPPPSIYGSDRWGAIATKQPTPIY
jgi:hypothetical protein